MQWPTTHDEAREMQERPTFRPYASAPTRFDEESRSITRPRLCRSVPAKRERRSDTEFEAALTFETAQLKRQIGVLSAMPRVLLPPAAIRALAIDHRAAFVLAQIDGGTSYESLMDLSAMPVFETLRVLVRLIALGVIG
jgi:hypothetical protein